MPRSRRQPPAAPRHPRSLGTAILVVLIGLMAALPAAALEVARVRHFSGPDHTRVVLDLDGPAPYELRVLDDPARLVIDVLGARFAVAEDLTVADGLVDRVRCNPLRSRAQVVLDLAVATAPYRDFDLRAEGERPDRIVLDVLRPGASPSSGMPAAPPPASNRVVVIDPGHGGLDPGAVRSGVEEKDIVLDVSRRLRDLLDALPGYTAVLTRAQDWYPSLADRVETAAAADGDLFVSIHCNTHRSRSVRGMEVYFLSLQGATDREARELADKENAADLVGLAADQRAGDAVLSILMDLHMTRVLRQSSRLSESILGAAADAGLPTRRVKQAGFQVLRSLAMPSALVELAYLSNREDRRLLTSAEGRQKLAEALAAGIAGYQREPVVSPPAVVAAGELPWTRRYRVRQGDNLYRLSLRYGTTVEAIRERNDLSDDRIRLGQYLSLPEGRPEP